MQRIHEGFVYLDEVLPGVRWDARYATEDNFTGKVVEGYRVNRVVGTREMAEGLRKAQRRAAELGYGLLLWDGYRPQRAVNCFLRWAQAPEDGRTKERHYPNIERAQIVPLGYVAPRSGHSRGGAIDLTLCDAHSGEPLDMDGGFDLLDEHSHHGAANVSPEAARNRALLCEIMEASGFKRYINEWWHYSLRQEPYPDTYFDFPVE